MSTTLVIAIAVVIGVGIGVWEFFFTTKKAPLGYQDETGFHIGTPNQNAKEVE